MGLSHPPGWDNISPDVKIGEYSCLKSEKFPSQEWENISPDVQIEGIDLSPVGEILFSHWRQIYTQTLHVWGNVVSSYGVSP